MDRKSSVVPDGIVYIRGKTIAAVQPAGAPPLLGFERVDIYDTHGTLYPGLIELHNHLSYNALPLWSVPRKYTNRSQWQATRQYHRLVTGPMSVLGRLPEYVNAIVRFVQCRCLLGGVTTSQGVALFSNAGIIRHYGGLVRNVEAPGDLGVKAALAHITDVDSKDADKFLAQLNGASCLLLHLSEGIDRAAHDHFEALHLKNGRWAIASSLVGIHSVALKQQDFTVMQQHGASMVWSPLSNLLLYGQTADIAAAKASAIRIGIGSDWAPSGSKNLLGELKIAKVVSTAKGNVFSDEEIVAMATRDAARILKWDTVIGSIESGKRADLIVIKNRQYDPYTQLIRSRETDLSLVLVDGVPCYGTAQSMSGFDSHTEDWKVGGEKCKIRLVEDNADPAVGALTLRRAYSKLADGLDRLPELAKQLEHPSPRLAATLLQPSSANWSLVLDQGDPIGMASRPHLPFNAKFTAMPASRPVNLWTKPLSQELVSQTLEPLTAVDDANFLGKLQMAKNLPSYVKAELPKLYS